MRTYFIFFILTALMLAAPALEGRQYDRSGPLSGTLVAPAVAGSAGADAAFYNPAATVFLPDFLLTLTAGIDLAGRSFSGKPPYPGYGTTGQGTSQFVQLPAFAVVRSIRKGLSVSLTGYSPFEIHTAWDEPSIFSGRFLAANVLLRTYEISSSLAFAPGKRFSFSAGVSGVFSSIALDRLLPVVLNGNVFNAGLMKLSGTARGGFGAVVSAFLNLNDRTSAGLSWRSQRSLRIDGGEATVLLLDTGSALIDDAAAATLLPSQNFSTQLILPAQVRAAVRHTFAQGKALSLAAALFLTKNADNLLFDFTAGYPQIDLRTATDNRLEISAVYEHALSASWLVRAGYGYSSQEAEAGTLNPAWAPATGQSLALALSYQRGGVLFTLAGQVRAPFSAEAPPDGFAGLAGKYTYSSSNVSFSVAYPGMLSR